MVTKKRQQKQKSLGFFRIGKVRAYLLMKSIRRQLREQERRVRLRP